MNKNDCRENGIEVLGWIIEIFLNCWIFWEATMNIDEDIVRLFKIKFKVDRWTVSKIVKDNIVWMCVIVYTCSRTFRGYRCCIVVAPEICFFKLASLSSSTWLRRFILADRESLCPCENIARLFMQIIFRSLQLVAADWL